MSEFITIESEKDAIASRLEDACRGAVSVEYRPEVHLEGDLDAEGHLYVGRFLDNPEDATLVLDDRKGAPLAVQAIHELNRIRDAADRAAAEFRASMPFAEQDRWFKSTRQPSAN